MNKHKPEGTSLDFVIDIHNGWEKYSIPFHPSTWGFLKALVCVFRLYSGAYPAIEPKGKAGARP